MWICALTVSLSPYTQEWKWTDPENQGKKKWRSKKKKKRASLQNQNIWAWVCSLNTKHWPRPHSGKCLYGFYLEIRRFCLWKESCCGIRWTKHLRARCYRKINFTVTQLWIRPHQTTTSLIIFLYTLNQVLVPRTTEMITKYKIILIIKAISDWCFPHPSESKCGPCWWLALDSGSGLGFDWAQSRRRSFSSSLRRSCWSWRWT